jgi:hypothetical protein
MNEPLRTQDTAPNTHHIIHRQTDKQTDRQTDIQTDRQTDIESMGAQQADTEPSGG